MRKKNPIYKIPPEVKYIIGVDEAGRGPLAGPVAVGVFAVRTDFDQKFFKGVRDSKQLTEKRREEWFLKIKKGAKGGKIHFAVSMSHAQTIDSGGLASGIRAALARALARLRLRPSSCLILLDGGLKAPAFYKHQQTIIRGDESIPHIACASIMAKVTRDRYMRRKAKLFPEYYFEIHKGYGTAKHYKQIKKHGLSPLHRRSFLKNLYHKDK